MSIHLKNKEEMEYSKVYTYYVSYKEPKKDRKEYHFYSSPEIDEYLQHEKIEYVKDDKQNFFKVLCITSEIKDKEIERLKKELEQQNIETGLEVERLKNRINNTVEYINNPSYFDGSYMTKHDLLMLLSGTIVKEHSIRDMKKIKEQLQELKGDSSNE